VLAVIVEEQRRDVCSPRQRGPDRRRPLSGPPDPAPASPQTDQSGSAAKVHPRGLASPARRGKDLHHFGATCDRPDRQTVADDLAEAERFGFMPVVALQAQQLRRLGGGAGGRTRTGTGLAALRIFLPLRLSPPRPRAAARGRVRGLDYPFTVARTRVRCCPSSLYTFSGTFAPEAWLGIAI
jgi:hypothetical protein